MKQFLLAALGFLVVACSHVEADHTTNANPISFDTHVNTEPVSRQERIRLLDLEEHRSHHVLEPLEKKRADLQLEHNDAVAELQREFPACSSQKHCNSDLFRGDADKMIRYNELIAKLRRFDFQLFEVLAAIEKEKKTHNLVMRNIYNRYLVYEILQVPNQYPFFQRFMVHDLEAFSNKTQILGRLFQFTDNLKPRVQGDLQFSMLGHEVDDGSILLTLDIMPMYPNSPEFDGQRYLISFLVNSHELDPQFYERIFLKEWANLLWAPKRDRLKLESYCGIYAISSDSLSAEFDRARKEKCTDLRSLFNLKKSQEMYFDHFAVKEWLLPIAYREYELR